MIKKRLVAIAMSLPLLLAACDEIPVSSGAAAGDVSRLQSLGYDVTGRSADGSTTVLRYSGPVNASVRCGTPSGPRGTLKPRVVAANGTVLEYELNTHLVVSGGGAVRDGLYVVSQITRPSGRGASKVESIAFEPGTRGTFVSGLSCQAT
ncbi:pyruvate/2-oxoglutarate dehydrogenase complex [Tateyamaria armeniaca]|uniref:Pyruvate/2-oxoglutarate dehydrogenase complex n=1 Tax=Tateyamaria armeniaca TaxID=2518930 RepID=A0ABW8USR7_9RHOB